MFEQGKSYLIGLSAVCAIAAVKCSVYSMKLISDREKSQYLLLREVLCFHPKGSLCDRISNSGRLAALSFALLVLTHLLYGFVIPDIRIILSSSYLVILSHRIVLKFLK